MRRRVLPASLLWVRNEKGLTPLDLALQTAQAIAVAVKYREAQQWAVIDRLGSQMGPAQAQTLRGKAPNNISLPQCLAVAEQAQLQQCVSLGTERDAAHGATNGSDRRADGREERQDKRAEDGLEEEKQSNTPNRSTVHPAGRAREHKRRL